MGSYSYGKKEIIAWIKDHFEEKATCLDVGPCDGKYANLLDGYLTIDACEIFAPNIENHRLRWIYREVFNADIKDLYYEWYDLIIFGDVIEHMTVEDAQTAIRYAWDRCHDMIIAVPWLYTQDEMYGNKWEKHLQPDLTPKVFEQRYPGFELIWANNEYAYYHKRI